MMAAERKTKFFTCTIKGDSLWGVVHPIKYLMVMGEKMRSNHSTTRLEWFKHANDRSKTDENFSTAFLISFPSTFIFHRGKS